VAHSRQKRDAEGLLRARSGYQLMSEMTFCS